MDESVGEVLALRPGYRPQGPVTGMAAAAGSVERLDGQLEVIAGGGDHLQPGVDGAEATQAELRSCSWLDPDAIFGPFDRDGEVLALALDRVHLAVELADPDDAVEERGVAVVVEDRRRRAPSSRCRRRRDRLPFGRALERQLAGKRAVFSTLLWSRKVSVSGS